MLSSILLNKNWKPDKILFGTSAWNVRTLTNYWERAYAEPYPELGAVRLATLFRDPITNLMGLTKHWVGLAFQQPYQELCREPIKNRNPYQGPCWEPCYCFRNPYRGNLGTMSGTLSDTLLSWILLSGTLSAFRNPYWDPCWDPCWPSGIFNRRTKWPSRIFKISLVLHKLAKWKL